MTTTAVSRGELARHVYERVREGIVRGTRVPGERVVEQDVAATLEVGRTPVREALQQLLQERLLVASGGGRRLLSVAPLRAADAEELFGLLGELEGAALRRLDTLEPPARLRLAETAAAANHAFGGVVSRVPLDQEGAFRTHQAFHASLTDTLAGPRLAWLLGLVRPQVERYEWFYGAALEGRLDVATGEHEAVVAALRRGDAAAAEAAVRKNWSNAGRRLADAIANAGTLVH
jgi:DNA-binding GntR family transcriptional regulator